MTDMNEIEYASFHRRKTFDMKRACSDLLEELSRNLKLAGIAFDESKLRETAAYLDTIN